MYTVRQLRLEKGWNQNELAFHADLAPSVISQIETGKREPSATTLRKLADALGVDIPTLFERDNSPKVLAPLEDEERREKEVKAKPEDLERAARIYEAHTSRWETELDLHKKAGTHPWGKSKEAGHYNAYLNRLLYELGWLDQAVRMRDEEKRADPRFKMAIRLIDAVKAQDEVLRRIEQFEAKQRTSGFEDLYASQEYVEHTSGVSSA